MSPWQPLSSEATELLATAAATAAAWGSMHLKSEHLLWAAAQINVTGELLRECDVDPKAVTRAVEAALVRGARHDGPVTLAQSARRTLDDALSIARSNQSPCVEAHHLLLALCADADSAAGRLLREVHRAGRAEGSNSVRDDEPNDQASTPSGVPTPMLEAYTRDLTADAAAGRLDPVIGRDDVIEQAVEVLCRRTKNNPVLVGEPGVGKTAVVEGLAQRIAAGAVPGRLRGRRVLQLDLAGLVAGTRYRGEFEERMTSAVGEIRELRDELIVFIDELHTVLGAGSVDGALDVANILKPTLAQGDMHAIGATTLDEYRRRVERDPALERRFQPITVPESGRADTIMILRGLHRRYEDHHRVHYSDSSLIAAVDLADRYIPARFLPDKAIDLMDQAGARVALRAGATVTEHDVAQIVSRMTGIPVTQLTQEEKERLIRMEDHLGRRVIGQGEAVAAVAEAIRRSRAGLADPSRPMGSFLFLGPTGVGKTELARALAEVLFGHEERMVRLDMSEFQERHTVSRLVGAPPGYVGFDEAGQLTEAVRRSPYSVVLLDEVEKAHPDVFNTLLQVLDDGRLTDARGNTVDFSNTVLIMTSNLVADMTAACSRQRTAPLPPELRRQLQAVFRPEFLNRIDEIIVFRALEHEELCDITKMLIEETERRLLAQGIALQVTGEAVRWLVDQAYQPDFGARPLRRTVQRTIDTTLSRMMLDDAVHEGDRVLVDIRTGELAVYVLGPEEDPVTTDVALQ